jgi:hypothetical protein
MGERLARADDDAPSAADATHSSHRWGGEAILGSDGAREVRAAGGGPIRSAQDAGRLVFFADETDGLGRVLLGQAA